QLVIGAGALPKALLVGAGQWRSVGQEDLLAAQEVRNGMRRPQVAVAHVDRDELELVDGHGCSRSAGTFMPTALEFVNGAALRALGAMSRGEPARAERLSRRREGVKTRLHRGTHGAS